MTAEPVRHRLNPFPWPTPLRRYLTSPQEKETVFSSFRAAVPRDQALVAGVAGVALVARLARLLVFAMVAGNHGAAVQIASN